MSPFQPTVVRGFSKYTRITMQRSGASSSAALRRRSAYSWAAAGSWTEHGPTTTSSRSLRPARMSDTSSRARVTMSDPFSERGCSSMRIAGGNSGWMRSMRRSRVFIRQL